jgi:hypothetical protein
MNKLRTMLYFLSVSFSFENLLSKAGYAPRPIVMNRNMSIYCTSIPSCPAGVFTAIAKARPMPADCSFPGNDFTRQIKRFTSHISKSQKGTNEKRRNFSRAKMIAATPQFLHVIVNQDGAEAEAEAETAVLVLLSSHEALGYHQVTSVEQIPFRFCIISKWRISEWCVDVVGSWIHRDPWLTRALSSGDPSTGRTACDCGVRSPNSSLIIQKHLNKITTVSSSFTAFAVTDARHGKKEMCCGRETC